jgi:GNAT superfamily N-acetyltransferase
MNDDYSIRTARFDELETLREIERAAGRRFADIGLGAVAESEPVPLDTLQALQPSAQVWVAADADARPVGFIVAFVFDGAIHIEEISVLPDHGRRGLGRQLIETVAERAKRDGFPALTLSTFRDVPWNAPFYGQIGFRAVDERDMSANVLGAFQEETRAWHPLARVWMRRDL